MDGCMDGWMGVDCSSTKKVNLRFSNENAVTNFRKTLYVGSGAQVLPKWSVVTKCAYLIHHLHICSDWLIIKKANIQSSVWATVTKLSMWVVIDTSSTHDVCCHQMHIFNTTFPHLHICSDWLTTKKVKYPESPQYKQSRNQGKFLGMA